MNDDALARVRAALSQLIVDGNNLLANAAGPNSRTRLRRDYLNWRDQSEEILARASAEVPRQSDRHRDIVRDVIPDDTIFTEVQSETRFIQQHLRPAANPVPDPDPSQDSFTSDRGELYAYNRSQRLGRPGRFGQVYAASDDAGTPLAVKEVLVRTDPERAPGDWTMVERELKVARATSKRAGLLPVLDSAHLDDRLMIVMPRAERSLADAIRDGISRDEATAAIREVADALQQLAVIPIAHRDLKPENILWWDGRWCIADFGIARLLDVTTATLTWEGTGTAEYRAPNCGGASLRPPSVTYMRWGASLSRYLPVNGLFLGLIIVANMSRESRPCPMILILHLPEQCFNSWQSSPSNGRPMRAVS